MFEWKLDVDECEMSERERERERDSICILHSSVIDSQMNSFPIVTRPNPFAHSRNNNSTNILKRDPKKKTQGETKMMKDEEKLEEKLNKLCSQSFCMQWVHTY